MVQQNWLSVVVACPNIMVFEIRTNLNQFISGRINFVRWRLMLVGPSYGACCISPFWPVEYFEVVPRFYFKFVISRFAGPNGRAV